MTDTDMARPTDQALVNDAPAGHRPSGVDPSREPLRCTFCAKTQDEVSRLIAGPGVFICDECVDLCGEIVREERKPVGNQRGVPCPGCGERISMVAAVGEQQRWGLEVKPGPSGLLQAKTVAGMIDGAQKMMRASCREDGINVQTYVEAMVTAEDGTVSVTFATLPVAKKTRDTDGSPKGRDAQRLDGEAATAGAEGIAETPSDFSSRDTNNVG